MHEIEKFASQFVDQHPKTVAKAFEKFPVEESYGFLKRLSEHQQISLIRKIEPGLSSSILNLFCQNT
jgi:Mg/Co/Ni transporter MgtE